MTRMQNSSKMNSISLEEEMTEFINNQVILDRGWGCERGGLAKKREGAVRKGGSQVEGWRLWIVGRRRG